MAEQWRDIPGYEGRYQVSDLGNVRSLDRVVFQRSKFGQLIGRNFKGKLLRQQQCSNGYIEVHLGANNQKLVHRLVALAFIEGDQSLQVNHKNGNRRDNRVENLEWATCSENHCHSYRNLNRKQHALTKTVIVSRGIDRKVFSSGMRAASFLGVRPGSVASAAIRGHKCQGYEVSYGA